MVEYDIPQLQRKTVLEIATKGQNGQSSAISTLQGNDTINVNSLYRTIGVSQPSIINAASKLGILIEVPVAHRHSPVKAVSVRNFGGLIRELAKSTRKSPVNKRQDGNPSPDIPYYPWLVESLKNEDQNTVEIFPPDDKTINVVSVKWTISEFNG